MWQCPGQPQSFNLLSEKMLMISSPRQQSAMSALLSRARTVLLRLNWKEIKFLWGSETRKAGELDGSITTSYFLYDEGHAVIHLWSACIWWHFCGSLHFSLHLDVFLHRNHRWDRFETRLNYYGVLYVNHVWYTCWGIMSYLITLYVHEILDFFQSSVKLNYIPARFMTRFQEKAHHFFFLCISVSLN